MKAEFSRDLFEADYDTAWPTPDDARAAREALILQLLGYGYDVTLTEPLSKFMQTKGST